MNNAQPGDLVIHYAKGAIRAFSEVLRPAQKRPRPDDTQDRWGEEGQSIDVDFHELDTAIELEDVSIEVRMNRSNPGPFDKNGRVKQGYFYSINPTLQKYLLDLLAIDSSNPASTTPEQLAPIDFATDYFALSRHRIEQPILRKKLLAGSDIGICALCDEQLPAKYLVAAHIKRRSQSSNVERRDLNNVMLACQLGCDLAFERGDLFVDDTGILRASEEIPEILARRINKKLNMPLPNWSKLNSHYYSARNQTS